MRKIWLSAFLKNNRTALQEEQRALIIDLLFCLVIWDSAATVYPPMHTSGCIHISLMSNMYTDYNH